MNDYIGLGAILALWLIVSYIRFKPYITKHHELIIFSYRLTDRYGQYVIGKFIVYNLKKRKFVK